MRRLQSRICVRERRVPPASRFFSRPRRTNHTPLSLLTNSHSFTTTPRQIVYDPHMPDRLPPVLFVRRLAVQLFQWQLFGMRALFVSTVWLALLPYMTIQVWRFYFWLGEGLCVNSLLFRWELWERISRCLHLDFLVERGRLLTNRGRGGPRRRHHQHRRTHPLQ